MSVTLNDRLPPHHPQARPETCRGTQHLWSAALTQPPMLPSQPKSSGKSLEKAGYGLVATCMALFVYGWSNEQSRGDVRIVWPHHRQA